MHVCRDYVFSLIIILIARRIALASLDSQPQRFIDLLAHEYLLLPRFYGDVTGERNDVLYASNLHLIVIVHRLRFLFLARATSQTTCVIRCRGLVA
jgi:hypothetical protein